MFVISRLSSESDENKKFRSSGSFISSLRGGMFSQLSSLQAGVHFKLLDKHKQVGSLHDREHVQNMSSNTASASDAASPDIHLISNPPEKSIFVEPIYLVLI